MKNGSSEKQLPLFKIIYKNLLLIILITVLCALLGLGYSVMKVKPTFTASRSVILRTDMNDSATNSSALTNQASLAKLYLPVVSSVVRSPAIIEKANDVYKGENSKVSAGGVGIRYNENSLIFTMYYTDKDEDTAKAKLEAVISAASDNLRYYLQAGDVTLIHTQNDSTVSSANSYSRYTLMGAGVGFVIAILLVFIVYVLDNTVKDKQEFEELTGLNVIAYIEKDKKKK